MRATAKPLLIALLRGARISKEADNKKVDLIHKLSDREIQKLDDSMVVYLRLELDALVMDKLIADRFKGLSGDTETATDGN